MNRGRVDNSVWRFHICCYHKKRGNKTELWSRCAGDDTSFSQTIRHLKDHVKRALRLPFAGRSREHTKFQQGLTKDEK